MSLLRVFKLHTDKKRKYIFISIWFCFASLWCFFFFSLNVMLKLNWLNTFFFFLFVVSLLALHCRLSFAATADEPSGRVACLLTDLGRHSHRYRCRHVIVSCHWFDLRRLCLLDAFVDQQQQEQEQHSVDFSFDEGQGHWQRKELPWDWRRRI